jgi:hypothetical protein
VSDIPTLLEWYFYSVKVLLQTPFAVILYLPFNCAKHNNTWQSQIKLRSNITCLKANIAEKEIILLTVKLSLFLG